MGFRDVESTASVWLAFLLLWAEQSRGTPHSSIEAPPYPPLKKMSSIIEDTLKLGFYED